MAAAAMEADDELLGKRVVLHSLSRADMNGFVAIAERFDKGRYVVRILSGGSGATHRVKAANLKTVQERIREISRDRSLDGSGKMRAIHALNNPEAVGASSAAASSSADSSSSSSSSSSASSAALLEILLALRFMVELRA